jgi:S1-C subfamily serine protease
MDDRAAEQTAAGTDARRTRLPRPGSRAGRTGLFAAGALAMVIALLVYHAAFPGPAPLTRRDVAQSIASALASQTPGPPLSEAAYAAIAPSLVEIEATGTAQPSGSAAGTGAAAAEPTESLGTGVVVNAAGAILTSLHVVEGAGTITVTFSDGTTSSATIATRQPALDIAVLQADSLPATVTPATIGNPGAIRVGSEVYVVGNPFGLLGSMSAGVVSGLHRTFQLPNGGPLLTELIQVDAAVNPGNSGGPLLDRDGRVVGVVTALINPTTEHVFIGIGLAVPINVAGGAAGLPQD